MMGQQQKGPTELGRTARESAVGVACLIAVGVAVAAAFVACDGSGIAPPAPTP